MKDVNSVQNIPRPREVPRQVQRQEPVEHVERVERPQQVERTERSVEKHAVTRTRTTTETSHSVQERGRQEPVLDAQHRLLYMRNIAQRYDDTNPVTQTLTYTQEAAAVTTTSHEGSQPLLDVRV